MPSATYRFFERAMRDRKQVHCRYGGHRRALCPIILGHSRGEEKALTYQVGGGSSSGLPPGGEWRCLWLAKVSEAQPARRPLARRLQPHPAAGLRRGRRPRRQPGEPLRPAAPLA